MRYLALLLLLGAAAAPADAADRRAVEQRRIEQRALDQQRLDKQRDWQNSFDRGQAARTERFNQQQDIYQRRRQDQDARRGQLQPAPVPALPAPALPAPTIPTPP